MSTTADPVTARGVVDVVLVEDSDDDALLVRKRLDPADFHTTHARTLADALAAIRPADRPMCVLLDLSLPDADGLDGLERIQHHAPEVPIVVLTGNADESFGLQALAAGAQDYLVKGRTSGDAVERSIRYAVERKQNEFALAEVRERFRRAFEDGPLGMALISYARGECLVIDANRRLADMTGRAARDLLGTRIDELTHWQDRADQLRLYDGITAGEVERHSTDRRLIHADGHVVWCTVTESVVHSPTGELLYGIALVDDVTDRKMQEEALREAHQALDTAVLGIAMINLDGRIRTVNPFYASALGYERHELAEMPWEMTVHADDRPLVHEALSTAAGGASPTVEVHSLRNDGTTFVTEVFLVPNTADDGRISGFFYFMRDVTERRGEQRALEESEARYRRIVETANDGVWIVDEHDVTTFVNPRIAQMFGYDPEEMIGVPFAAFARDQERDRGLARPIHRETEQQWHREQAFRRKDGGALWGSISGARLMDLLDDRKYGGTLLMVSDITERKHAEVALTQMALHDQLTGLPNRALLEDRIRRALASSGRHETVAAVLFIDLDRFKTINDGFGHEVGDELLRGVVSRLAGVIRSVDTLGRFGGDEFVVVCEDLDDANQALRVADRMLDALKAPLALSIGDVPVGASVGIAVSGATDVSVEDLLRDADIAMYRAKKAGGGRREVFDASMRAIVVEQLNLERDLRSALAEGALSLHYQPIVSLPDERVVGFEALLRWQHAERGFVPPDAFIPIAERCGLIGEIGAWVLREACGQLARWTADGGREWARVAVNVSARQIDQPDFASEVARILEETGADPHRLDLEITETALFAQDARLTSATLLTLGELGVSVVLDDFGTGYSSLSYLSRYPLGGLKLDRAFISDVESVRRPIVEAVTAMSHALGHSLVGEGVETVEQASLLAALGCDYAQGYLFARPMPAHEVEDWLATRARHLTDASGRLSVEPDREWMALGEAAAAIGLSASTLRRWNDEGRVQAQRTAGGHRRFAVADLKSLAPSVGVPKLNLDAFPTAPVPRVSVLLDSDGDAVLTRVTGGLYEKPTRGWFVGDRARRPLRRWMAAFGRACRNGIYDELTDATTGLVRQAEVAGASLLECSLFIERFTAAVVRALPEPVPGQRDDHADIARVVVATRRSVVAGR